MKAIQLLSILLISQINFFYGYYYGNTDSLNINNACENVSYPSDETKQSWYFGDQARCIDSMCYRNLPKYFIKLFPANSTHQTISVAQQENDETKVDLKVISSVKECPTPDDPAASNGECINSPCWQTRLQSYFNSSQSSQMTQSNSDYNERIYTIDKTFYTNTDRCTVDTSGDHNIYTCPFKIDMMFSNIEDFSIATKQFEIKLTVLGSADIIQAEVNSVFATKEQTIADAISDNVRDTPMTKTGTLSFADPQPASFTTGDQVDLVLKGPADFDQRLFNLTKEISIKLKFTGGEIMVSPKATPAAANTATEEGQNNTLTFSFDANYIGSYSISVQATLNPEPVPGLRRLMEIPQENHIIDSTLPITIKPKGMENSQNIYIVICIVLLILTFGAVYSIYQNRKKDVKYQLMKRDDTYLKV